MHKEYLSQKSFTSQSDKTRGVNLYGLPVSLYGYLRFAIVFVAGVNNMVLLAKQYDYFTDVMSVCNLFIKMLGTLSNN